MDSYFSELKWNKTITMLGGIIIALLKECRAVEINSKYFYYKVLNTM